MFGTLKSSVSTLTNQSIDLYEKGLYKKAKKLCVQAIKQNAQNYQCWVNLGNIYFIEKNFSQAIDAYQNAVDSKADYYPAHINLANTFLELEDYEKSVNSALKSLTLDSQSYMAYSVLGNAYLGLQNYTDSLLNLEAAIKLDSSDPWLYNSLSQAAQKLDAFDKALNYGWQAVLLSLGEEAHQINFGYLLYEVALDNHQEAAKKYAKLWLEKFPTDSIALHMGNAILNDSQIPKANNKYLKKIFDVFAKDFENVLADLNYQTPQHIAGFLKEIYKDSNSAKLQILDAGCGTGLCGKFLHNYAKKGGLVGVDLSTSMLQIAEGKKLYSHLYEQELELFLSTQKQTYDLIVSADVFTYFGSLDSLFSALHSALKNSGRVIFNITENKLNEEAYFLHISGRFIHKIDYVKQILKKHNFKLEKSRHAMLRREGDEDVYGYILSALKL